MYPEKDRHNPSTPTCAKTRQELAEEYKVHRNTFTKMLKRAGIDLPSGLISPKDQELIYEKLGRPTE